jgi:HlyD family secretion protein
MPNELAQRGSIETESEMLPQDPPPWFVRSLAWLLISMFSVALLASIFVHLPETVTCPFVLVAAGGADPIQSPRLAVIEQVAVAEGETIKRGAPLFILRSDEIRGFSTEQRTMKEDLKTTEEGLTKADAAYLSQVEIKTAEIAQAESEVKFREKHAATARDLIDRMQMLTKNGGISKVEMLRYQLEASESEKDYSVAQRTLQQVNLELAQIKNEHARVRDENVAEIEKLKVRLAALTGDLENSRQNLLTIRAPYDGVVISLAQRNAGSVVQNGQELCQLSPANAKPIARLTLSESGLPKLQKSQVVRLFFDAFPYQRYGVVEAKLDWISPAAVASAGGPHFVAIASLNSAGNRAQHPLAVRVGMTGEARIVTGERTIIEYAFEPIRQLRENTGG